MNTKKNIKKLVSGLCMSFIFFSSTNVYAYNGGTTVTPPGTWHGDSDPTTGTIHAGGNPGGGGGSHHSGHSGGVKEQAVSRYHHYTDDWGSWNTSSVSDYVEDASDTEETHTCSYREYQKYIDKNKTIVRYEWKIYTKDNSKENYRLLRTEYNSSKNLDFTPPKPAFYYIEQTPLYTPIEVYNERTDTVVYHVLYTGGASSDARVTSRSVSLNTSTQNKMPEVRQDQLMKHWEGWFEKREIIEQDMKIVSESMDFVPKDKLIK